MHDAKTWLDAWRDAERRRDGFAHGTPGWEEADVEVRTAKRAFDAAFAQAYAQYREERYEAQHPHRAAEAHRSTSEVE